ncbi:MAG TPA: hypothetical protein DIT64_10345 [Verrucomicrobiales bacterium]|nr:hypothetical protein [Verrucomicrobiales bacterium]
MRRGSPFQRRLGALFPVEAVLAVTKGQTGSRTDARYAHPWFGPLDETAWHALAAFHLRLHRRQIERILEGLLAGRS